MQVSLFSPDASSRWYMMLRLSLDFLVAVFYKGYVIETGQWAMQKVIQIRTGSNTISMPVAEKWQLYCK
jgi:hypothetical protein